MELIEKMARAIMDHRSPMQPGLQWNIESDENRDWYRGLAQAALTALIEHAGGDGVTESERDRWFPADDEQAALAECLAHVDDPRNAEQLAAELRKRGYKLFWTVVQG